MSEPSSVVARYVTKMRHMAQKSAEDVDVADCLWSGAALLELMERQHRHLFDLLSGPPRILRADVPADAAVMPGEVVR